MTATADATVVRPPPAKKGWTPARVGGALWVALWLVIAFLAVRLAVTEYSPAFYARYGPRILHGLLITVELVALSVSIGAAIAIPIAFARGSKNSIISGLAYSYVYFFRGTPLLAQTFLVYYGAGQFRETLEAAHMWWFFRDAFNCAVFTFALNTSAYQAEIFRGAIDSVPKGQTEAGEALGLSQWPIFNKIVAPQAMIIALRPLGNEIILMIKGSAIASIITVFDLMGETRLAFSRTYDFQVYLWAAVLYLSMVEILRRVWDRIEARLTRHLKRLGE
ncbi:MAG: ABC transporter permease [Rhodobiaceae bacterium]|nr:ABC transporter permease [Rhodobiaceae bacterium]MCC0018355.1 ABC transporter permease [Rhodobiaceae bacterium]MCC0051148.1 ABC transporter permease [Rhodobiaceae bacterium]MCC0060213.1 ABC transporter permease [Rhodobiaceae bacterium]